MEIRFISTLTPEDENRVGPSLLHAISSLLDNLPLAYTLRIETTGERVFQHDRIAPKKSGEFALPDSLTLPKPASDRDFSR